ncbi:MAG: glycosyltransferase family 4 protein [Chloroflexi bacterium]|nr:glycosyltransferase family 4 protein [Chloroflexota bacterium]
MRVLNVLHHVATGGPQLYALAVARKLRCQGVDVVFALPNGNSSFPATLKQEGFAVHQLTLVCPRPPDSLAGLLVFVRWVVTFPWSVYRLIQIMRQEHVDVVHVHSVLTLQAIFAVVLRRRTTVWLFHETLVPKWYVRFALVWGRLARAKMAVVAQAVADRYFPRQSSRPFLLHAPVDLERFDPTKVTIEDCQRLRKELHIPVGHRVVLTVSNIHPGKGIHYFVEAAARMTEERDDLTFVVVGKPLPSRASYQQRIMAMVQARGLEERFRFTGWRDDTPQLLAMSDLFILASPQEACPMVVLEAMAMAKPTIAMDTGGVKEIIQDGLSGIVTPPHQPDAIANAALALLADSGRAAALAANARPRMAAIFSLDTCAERHVALYLRALAESRRPPLSPSESYGGGA